MNMQKKFRLNLQDNYDKLKFLNSFILSIKSIEKEQIKDKIHFFYNKSIFGTDNLTGGGYGYGKRKHKENA